MLKRFKFLIIISVLGLLSSIPAFSKYQDLAQRNRSVRSKMNYLIAENKSLAQRQHRLQTDPVFAESVARQRLNVAKEDEVVYKVVPEKE